MVPLVTAHSLGFDSAPIHLVTHRETQEEIGLQKGEQVYARWTEKEKEKLVVPLSTAHSPGLDIAPIHLHTNRATQQDSASERVLGLCKGYPNPVETRGVDSSQRNYA